MAAGLTGGVDGAEAVAAAAAVLGVPAGAPICGRGLCSSTSQLNLSRF
jgi:hypothetical protein